MSSKKQLDALGDRMKGFEKLQTEQRLVPGLPIYVRLDGRGFSKFTKLMTRPYDARMSQLMEATAKYLVEEFQCTLGYVQSDEISLLIKNEYEASCTFEGKIQKLVSTIASAATAYFVFNFNKYFETENGIADFSSRLPSFDCRIFNLPTWSEASNAILWRYLDALKNSKQMLAHHHFSHSQLQNLNGKQLVDKLEVEKNVIWGDFPEFFRSGVFVQRETYLNEDSVTRHRVNSIQLTTPFHLMCHEDRISIVSNTVKEEIIPDEIVEVKKSLTELIQDFLKDTANTKLSIDYMPLSDFKNLMENDLGYKEQLDFEADGWECDFRMNFEKVGYPFLVLEGSLFYGNFKLLKEDLND